MISTSLGVLWCHLCSWDRLPPRHGLSMSVHVCCGGKQGFSARVLNARVYQRTLPKRPNPKYITMATIILMAGRSGAWGTHCPPPVGKFELSCPEKGHAQPSLLQLPPQMETGRILLFPFCSSS